MSQPHQAWGYKHNTHVSTFSSSRSEPFYPILRWMSLVPSSASSALSSDSSTVQHPGTEPPTLHDSDSASLHHNDPNIPTSLEF